MAAPPLPPDRPQRRLAVRLIAFLLAPPLLAAQLVMTDPTRLGADEAPSESGPDQRVELAVHSVSPPSAPDSARGQVRPFGVTRQDAQHLAQLLPELAREIVPVRIIDEQARFGSNAQRLQLVGTTVAWLQGRRGSVLRGRFLTPADEQQRRTVTVIDQLTAKRLFEYADPLGQRLLVGRDYFTVVGVVEPRASWTDLLAPPREQPSGDRSVRPRPAAGRPIQFIFIPLSTMRFRFGDLEISRRAGAFQARHFELTALLLPVRSVDLSSYRRMITLYMQAAHEQPDYRIVSQQHQAR